MPDRESQVRSGLVWGFFCQAVVIGFCSQFFVRSGKGRFSSRRLRSGSRSARRGSRDRNASGAWRLAALARLVFRSALTPEHAEVQGPHGGLVPAGLPGARTWQASGLRRSASCRDRADAREHIGGPLGCRRPATDLAAPGAGKTGPRAATSRNTASPPPSYIAEDAIV